MKKTILSVAVAEIIISCGMQTNVQAATINNTNDTNNTATISTLQKSGKVISIGSTGDVVRSIQRLLNSLEGCNIQEDGLYGSETYNAIIKYQAKNGLKQDGIVGKQTVEKLLGIDANPKSNTENPKKTDEVKIVNEKVISIGSKGDVVRSIQRLLNSLEGCNIQEDGLYGAETYNAIIKYQAKNSLKQDGIVGKQTFAKLCSTDAKPKSNTTNLNIANETKTAKVKTVNEMIQSELNSKEITSDTDYFIAVSKSQRQVYIYHKENNSWVNIKVFTCNIGAPDSPTIEGNFQSGLKGTDLRINETYVKYFTQISGNYLFHSVPYNEIGQVIDGRLGEAVSRGCVRLSLDDAKYIYDTIPARTGIKIIK